MNKFFASLLVCIAIGFTVAHAQTAAEVVPKGWHLLDLKKDGVYGINANGAYQFLKENNKKPTPIIIAVLDSGGDTTHEDLKNILWHNPKEIAGNGIDDDGNGYIDDVMGWNFLGGKDGSYVKKASEEKARVYHKYKAKYLNKTVDTTAMNEDELYEYQTWKRAANEFAMDDNDLMQVMLLEIALKSLRRYDDVLTKEMGVKEFTIHDLEKFAPTTKEGRDAKFGFLTSLKMLSIDASEQTNTALINDLDGYIEKKKTSMDAKDTAPEDVRGKVVKDDYTNFKDKYYGNNDVMGPGPTHGTHVSGIIGAQRNNSIGMDGVADNIQIMLVRVVPDGDEYDKDVALAIRYAVDNGAKVINMSFGKGFSPEKKWVDSAVRYAEQKDVLLVHAAGNENSNTDTAANFPNPYLMPWKTYATNFITVGASSDPRIDGNLVAEFSNYGKNTVDVFAPGVRIYSTLPHSTYGNQKGTSMASPVVAGIAGMIRSYYPKLTAKQVKDILMQSSTIPDSTVMVIKPGTRDELTTMSELCKSGGIVNAYGAVKAAENFKETAAPQIVTPTKKIAKEKLPASSFEKNKIK